MNLAITQMDETTQQNAALVEEAAAAAKSLQQEALALSKIVSTFKMENEAIKKVIDVTPKVSQLTNSKYSANTGRESQDSFAA